MLERVHGGGRCPCPVNLQELIRDPGDVLLVEGAHGRLWLAQLGDRRDDSWMRALSVLGKHRGRVVHEALV